MTFFHDLNKKLAALANKQDLHESKVAESEKWIQKAVNPAHKGGLHKALHVAQGEKIPKAKIDKATHSKNPKLRHMAQFAKNVANEGTCPGCGCSPCECVEEGNAFTGALAKTPKGGKFKVGGKEFTDTSSIEEKKEPKSKGTAFDPETAKKMFANKDEHPRHDVHDTGYSKRYTRKHEDDMEKDDEVKSDEPKKKGRPKSTKPKGDENVTKGSWKYKMVNGKRVKKEKADEALDTDGVMMTRPSNMSSESLDRNEYDAEGDMAKGDMHTIIRHAKELETHLRDNDNLPTWVIEKLGQIKGMMTSVSDYIMSEKERGIEHETGEEGIRIAEKAVSVAQRRAAGIAHAAQKGEIPKSKLRGASKEMAKMPKGELHKFAATKEKGLPTKVKEGGKPDFLDLDKDGNKTEPMKQAAKQAKSKKKEEVEETTVAGAVATATPAGKSSKGGMQFGKGVYESIDTKFKQLLAESISVESKMEECGDGAMEPKLMIQADGEDAAKLMMLLKLAGLEGQVPATCPQCGATPCGCDEIVDENSPDWPTDDQTLAAEPNLRTYSGGLNGPKSTGQSTTVGGGLPNMQARRQASMEESVELERSLFKTWKNYKG